MHIRLIEAGMSKVLGLSGTRNIISIKQGCKKTYYYCDVKDFCNACFISRMTAVAENVLQV